MEKNKTLRFAETNGITLESSTETTATAYIDITEKSLNHNGNIHGGLLFSLADNTAGLCAKQDGNNYVTLQGNMNYLEGINHGRIRATATLIRRGKRTSIIDVNITSDEHILIAKGNFIMYRLEQ